MEDKPTHQSWGNVIKGRFYINSEDGKEFMAMYNDAIENNVTDFSILEMQKEYSPIIVDIDLKIPTDDYQNKRLYDNNLINNIFKISSLGSECNINYVNYKNIVDYDIKSDYFDFLNYMGISEIYLFASNLGIESGKSL